uniref:DUF1996 domain-containing protein n=1 Tax=Globisporangium ultimum (strain ATCC 200006 / CBS 805.95 / DAOM BR144) TaxID=431595 RepID=K3X6B1_GLOUD
MLVHAFSAAKQLGLAAALLVVGSTHAMFRFDCFNNLVVDRVDPITSLGTAGGHLHAISGGNGFSMNADGDAMRNSSCTSCPIGADLSAYWVPQLYVKYKNGSGFGLVESHQIVGAERVDLSFSGNDVYTDGGYRTPHDEEAEGLQGEGAFIAFSI